MHLADGAAVHEAALRWVQDGMAREDVAQAMRQQAA